MRVKSELWPELIIDVEEHYNYIYPRILLIERIKEEEMISDASKLKSLQRMHKRAIQHNLKCKYGK